MSNDSELLLNELRESLGKMELALGIINEAIVWTDAQGVIQWCNAAFDALVERNHLLNLGQSLYELLPLQQNNQELPLAAHPLSVALRTKDSVHGVYQTSGKGEPRAIEFSVHLLSMPPDEQHAVIVLHDISKVKELEQLRLQGLALSAACNAIAITNKRGEVEWVNKSFVELTGYRLEQLYGKTMKILRSGRQDRKYYQELWRTIAKGEVWSGVLINKKADGTEYYEEQTITPVRGEAGEISHFIAIKSDVTEKVLFQKKLKKIEAKRSAILSGIIEGIVTISMDGVIEAINPACEKMFGYAPGELIGRNVRILMPQPHRQLHDNYIQRYLSTRVPHIIGFVREVEGQHKNGQTFPIELSISCIELEDETLFTAVLRDITKRKLIERQMEKMNAMLIEKQIQLNEDLSAAAAIQKALMPQGPPALPNLAMAWRFKPSAYVSGDIFNYFLLDTHTIAIYILDVCGHGVPAAMIALSVSQLLHQDSHLVEQAYVDGAFSPSRMLELLDQEFPIERFEQHFTMVFLTLDTASGIVRYSNAGHPYPVHCDTGGGCTNLECGGSIIGLGKIVPFIEGELQLNKGERLYLFTDGAIERESETGDQFGEDRLKHIINASVHRPLETATESLYDAVLQFDKKKRPLDDLTFVTLEYLG